jgi:two-component system alkaline phosphatase synthesis response regulator PhoP
VGTCRLSITARPQVRRASQARRSGAALDETAVCALWVDHGLHCGVARTALRSLSYFDSRDVVETWHRYQKNMAADGARLSPRMDTMTGEEGSRTVSERPPKLQALFVEDEASIREIVRLHLELAGFEVTEIGNGARALDLARTTRFDLIGLDVMLPVIDGVTICRALRAEGANTDSPILMLTAKDSESDKVIGLESGADDYLTKPFGTRELVARAGALVRRHRRGSNEPATSTRSIERRHFALDLDKRQARLRNSVLELTKQEFDLLRLLAGHPGVVFSREALLTRVWGGDSYVIDRTVDTVVSRLRRKMKTQANEPELIQTAWGVGYKFADVE